MQWAAVNTNSGWINVPPQLTSHDLPWLLIGPPGVIMALSQGQVQYWTGFPFTIRFVMLNLLPRSRRFLVYSTSKSA